MDVEYIMLFAIFVIILTILALWYPITGIASILLSLVTLMPIGITTTDAFLRSICIIATLLSFIITGYSFWSR